MTDANVIPAFYVANFLDFAVQNKQEQQRVLQASGIAAVDSSQLISLTALLKLIEGVCRHNPSTNLGVEFGRHLSPISHGILSQAAISSGTLQDIADMIGKYTVLRTPLVEVGFVRGTQFSEIRINACTSAATTQSLLTDIAISCIISVFEFVTGGGFASTKILLQTEKPLGPELRRFSQRNTPLIQYQQDRSAIIFPTSQLASVCDFSDKDIHQQVLQQCENELSQLSASKDIHQQLDELLKKDFLKYSKASHAAGYLNITTRTLRRRLQKQGYSFHAIVAELRQARAEHLLLNTRLNMARIAEQLGFNEASSFGKAFRKSAGCSPSQFRNKNH